MSAEDSLKCSLKAFVQNLKQKISIGLTENHRRAHFQNIVMGAFRTDQNASLPGTVGDFPGQRGGGNPGFSIRDQFDAEEGEEGAEKGKDGKEAKAPAKDAKAPAEKKEKK